MKKFFLTALLLLVGCTPVVATEVLPTATATPQPIYEKTGIRSSIEPLLFQDNDLTTANWVGDTYLVDLPDFPNRDQIPQPAFVAGRYILNIGYGERGFSTVSFYKSKDDLNKAYDLIFETDTYYEPLNTKYIDGKWRDLAFIQCDALIYIRSYGPLIEDITTYAVRLKDRLQPVICE